MKGNIKLRNLADFCSIVLILFFIQLLTSFVFVTYVYAHKVSTYAYREGDKVYGECYFVDGSPCKNSKVEVYDSKGQKILETKTDEKGKYAFVTKEKSTLRIIIPAGEGHRAEYKLEGFPEKTGKKETTEYQPMQSQISINKDELKQIIDNAMEAKMQGLRAEITDLRKQMDKITLRDIIGGIGYIFGVWGVVIILRRRKNAS